MLNNLCDQCARKARSCGIRTTVSSFTAIMVGVFVSAAWGTPQFPVHFSDDGRYLVDQAGTPFFINGDTPWSLITGLTKGEAERYLNDRQQRGFNAIIINLIEHFFNGPVNQEGHGPFLVAGDFSTPNDAYFAHIDWILNKALDKGFVVFMTPAYLGYQCGNQGWCAEVRDNGPEKMYEYGRYVGQRFRNFPNIIWIGGGDTNANDYLNVTEAMEAMIEGISQSAPGHLFTAHCHRNMSAVDCYDRAWLDINNTYSDCTKTAPQSLMDFRRGRPFFLFEGRYENESATDVCLRSQAYWSVLAGSMGHFFGNNPIWKF